MNKCTQTWIHLSGIKNSYTTGTCTHIKFTFSLWEQHCHIWKQTDSILHTFTQTGCW